MRRNRLILTNRSADRTAWSTLLNYLRFIKYISNAAPRGCVRATYVRVRVRVRARARARAIPPARQAQGGYRAYTSVRVHPRARALRTRVCTTAVHNV